MVLNGDLRLFHLTLTSFNLSKPCRPWSDTVFSGVWSGSALYAIAPNVPVQVLQISLYQQHSDVTATRMTVTWSGLITLVNGNHVANYLKEFFCVCMLWIDCKQSTQKRNNRWINIIMQKQVSDSICHLLHCLTRIQQILDKFPIMLWYYLWSR